MSKIPSFGFKSKLKVPAVLKARTANAATNHKDNCISNSINPMEERPSGNSGYGIASYSSYEEICANDDGVISEQKNPESGARKPASKENIQHTSQTLSKLADKLNANTNVAVSGVASRIPPKPAFRRKNSSHIAKLNNGKSKERSGATQIHGQTPYMKSPRMESKPPLGAIKNGTDAPSTLKSRLSRSSGIPGSKGFVRKEGDKEVENANDTLSMPLKKQKGDSGQHPGQNEGKMSTTTMTTTTFRRPSSGGAAKSGLRPPSGNFTGVATGVAAPRTDTKMKPPSNPIGGSNASSKIGSNDSRSVNAKGFARRSSGQETAIVKRNSKENLRASNIALPKQKTPSVELQTMAEKFKSFSGKRLPRPASITSEVDLRKSAIKSKDRRSLNTTNLRTVHSSSLQDIPRRSLNADSSMRNPLHRRSSSHDRFTKDKNSRLSVSSIAKKDGQVPDSTSQALPPKQALGLKKPRPRSSCKTLSSTNSEFGVHDDVNGEPYQSTPVSKTALGCSVIDGNVHPFENALNGTLSGVFEDGPSVEARMDNHLNCRRVLNETFDGNGHDRTFDALPTKNGTFTTAVCLVEAPKENALGRNDTFCKEPRYNETFKMGASDLGTSESSMGTDESINLTSNSGALANGTARLSKSRNPKTDEINDNTAPPGHSDGSLSMASIDSCKVVAKENGAAKDLEELIDGYHSDQFLLNETMPTLDGSFAMNETSDISAAVPSSPVKEGGVIISELPCRPAEDGGVVVKDDIQRPKSASRELKFEGISSNELVPKAEEMFKAEESPKAEGISNAEGVLNAERVPNAEEVPNAEGFTFAEGITNADWILLAKGNENESVLATSLINDSYDVVTIEEASRSDTPAQEEKSTKSEIIKDDELAAKQLSGDYTPGDIGSDQTETGSGSNEFLQATDKASTVDERLPVGTKIADETDKAGSYPPSNAPNTSPVIETGSEGGRETGSEGGSAIPSKEKDFSSLLSQTVEDLAIANDTKTPANPESMIVNLLTPEDSSEAVKEILDSLSSNANQMKMAARRRSLVRRNTSPYVTSSLPGSLPSGSIFRMPRETSITETGDGNIIMDEGAYRHCQNDVRMIKTNLLRLKRALQEVDIVSPFVKHPSQYSSSPPVTPTRATMLNRSFSDASSWLTKVKMSDVPLGSDQRSKISKSLLNKTDEDKVKDEINDIKENQSRLERELEEAKHELESKNNTIKLLQTQLEHQEYMEQMELLLEEKIMLFEENQELKERIEELESEFRCRSSSVKSIKEEYLKQSKSASKIRSEIVKGYYEDK